MRSIMASKGTTLPERIPTMAPRGAFVVFTAAAVAATAGPPGAGANVIVAVPVATTGGAPAGSPGLGHGHGGHGAHVPRA